MPDEPMRAFLIAAALALSGCLTPEEFRERDPTGYWEGELERLYGRCRSGPCGASWVMAGHFEERDVEELREVLRKKDPFFAWAAARLLSDGTGDRTLALPELRGLLESGDESLINV